MPALDIHLSPVTFEYDPDEGPDAQVTIRQDLSGNISEVYLHPSQLALLATRMGMAVPALEPTDHAQRQIDGLKRKLAALHYRIDELDDWILMDNRIDDDIVTMSRLTNELAGEFMKEVDPDAPLCPYRAATQQRPATPPATAPATPVTRPATAPVTPATRDGQLPLEGGAQ